MAEQKFEFDLSKAPKPTAMPKPWLDKKVEEPAKEEVKEVVEAPKAKKSKKAKDEVVEAPAAETTEATPAEDTK